MTLGEQFHIGHLQPCCVHQRVEPNHRCNHALSSSQVECRARRCGESNSVAQRRFIVVEGVAMHNDAAHLVAATPVQFGWQQSSIHAVRCNAAADRPASVAVRPDHSQAATARVTGVNFWPRGT
jgi:hypothetical protein